MNVVGLLGDRDDADALASEHGLEGDDVLALAGEPGELPDEDFLEWSVGFGSLVDHPAELRAVGDAPALGIVHILEGDEVRVLLGVVPERPQLCGHGQIHVLPVAGDPGVEGCGCGVVSFNHRFLLLVSSCWVWRELRLCIRACLRHSLSSRWRRNASRRRSLTVRPSSLTTCLSCSSISGGKEKVITFVVLGVFCLA